MLLFIICCKFRWILLCIVYPSVRPFVRFTDNWSVIVLKIYFCHASQIFIFVFSLSLSLSVILIRWVGWSAVGQTGLDYLPSMVKMPKVIFWCCCLNQHHEKIQIKIIRSHCFVNTWAEHLRVFMPFVTTNLTPRRI